MLGEAIGRSPALSINACCSWVPVGFPISAGARTGESRCPYARPSVGERKDLPASERELRQQRVISAARSLLRIRELCIRSTRFGITSHDFAGAGTHTGTGCRQ